MPATPELTMLRRTIDELRTTVGALQHRYGEITAVRRLAADVERIELDASDLDSILPPPEAPPGEMHMIDDRPLDPALWADADDEGLGGYHRDVRQ